MAMQFGYNSNNRVSCNRKLTKLTKNTSSDTKNHSDIVENISFLANCVNNVTRNVKNQGHIFCAVILLLQLNGLVILTIAENISPAINVKSQYGKYAAKEFSTLPAIIQPSASIQISKFEIYISNTRLNNGLHAKSITIKFKLNNKYVTLDLSLNENLIPVGHFMRYQSTIGEEINIMEKTDIDLCQYKGKIRNEEKSNVAISTCNGINGFINDGVETFFIGPIKLNSRLTDDHLIFRYSDMSQTTKLHYKTNDAFDFFNRKYKRFKRSSAEAIAIENDQMTRIPSITNKHYVELVFVVDKELYVQMGENMKRVHKYCIDLANIVNSLYESLNISIVLVGVVIWNKRNEAEIVEEDNKTLENFLKYRRETLMKDHPNDIAQLLTNRNFSGSVVGSALLSTICSFKNSGSIVHIFEEIGIDAATVAHEMGHNFGMEHDTDNCECVDEKCIMWEAKLSQPALHWSSCNTKQLTSASQLGLYSCLMNKPKNLFASPHCGNGLVEPGEQCDCGLPHQCQNHCCNPKTCRLHENASCATGQCCNLSTCRLKSSGTVCREVAGECDLPEFCTGKSEHCPLNYFKRDTEECDNDKAYCYQGSCRSHDNQCKFLWGSSIKSIDACYENNKKEIASRNGNCGYDQLNKKYIKCLDKDIKCGMLMCEPKKTVTTIGLPSFTDLPIQYAYLNNGLTKCHSVVFDFGLQIVDPGLVPDGAKCNANKMCLGQKCVSIESLTKTAPKCSLNCNNHGVCNNKGQCHCDVGFAPPLCNSPGRGGSELSGPATKESDNDSKEKTIVTTSSSTERIRTTRTLTTKVIPPKIPKTEVIPTTKLIPTSIPTTKLIPTEIPATKLNDETEGGLHILYIILLVVFLIIVLLLFVFFLRNLTKKKNSLKASNNKSLLFSKSLLLLSSSIVKTRSSCDKSTIK